MVTTKALLLLVALTATSDTELLCFSSRWCEPCRQMQPIVERMEADGFRVSRIDVDQRGDTARRFQVHSVPAFVLVREGQVIGRIDGVTSYRALAEMVQRGTPNASPQLEQPVAPVVRGQSPGRFGQLSQAVLGAFSGDDRGSAQATAAPIPPRGTPPSLDPQPNLAASGYDQPSRFAATGNSAAQPFADDRPASTTAPPNVAPQNVAPQNAAPANAIMRALAATVRLRIDDEAGQSYGSGTIIHLHQGEALVLSCAHIFRSSQGRGPISVEMFADGRVLAEAGTLLSHDYKTDVALITFHTTAAVQTVPVAGSDYQATRGDTVVTIGCDQGQPPTVKPGRVLAINRYLGPANLVVSGRPIDGRSGGGVFTEDGRLIGVCNAADPQEDEGLYAALPRVYQVLDRNQLQFVYQASTPSAPHASPGTPLLADASNAQPRTTQALASRGNPPVRNVGSVAPALVPVPVPVPNADSRNTIAANDHVLASGHADVTPVTATPVAAPSDSAASAAADEGAARGMEIVCVIRSPGENGKSRVVVFDQPSQELLQAMSREYERQAKRDAEIRR